MQGMNELYHKTFTDSRPYPDSHNRPEDRFIESMRDAGIETDEPIIADGILHRFHVIGDRSGSGNGWYVLYAGEPTAGAFGCWKRGVSETWCSKEYHTLTHEEKARYTAKMEAMRQLRAEEAAKVQAECKVWCAETWDKAPDATNQHPYLKRKGVNSYGLKLLKDSLMAPLRDIAGTLHGIQFISSDGNKKFKTGTKKEGCFHGIGKPDNQICICEGYATGASIYEATGKAVAIAFDAGNLKTVAEIFRQKYSSMEIIMCSDDDHATEGNPGLTKATEAARVVNGKLAVPSFPDSRGPKDTDFNDLAHLVGLDAVRDCIEAAKIDYQERPEPLPLTRPLQANDPFPVEVLPPVIRSAILKVHEIIQAPLDMICQSFLAAATLAVQPYIDVLIDGRRFPVSNNFITIGESGERKSATDRLATGPIKERQRNESEVFHKEGQAYEAALAAWQNGKKAAFREEDKDVIEAALRRIGEEPKHVQPFYLFEEPSFEGIERAYSEGRYTLGLFSDEGGRFIGGYAMSKDNQTKTITGLSKLWDGDPIDRVRGGDGLSVLYGRRLSMHLMIQPILCGQLFGNSMLTGQGFLSRCLCSYPASTIGWRPYKAHDLNSDPAILAYNAVINNIMDKPFPLNPRQEMGLSPATITLSKDAKLTWIAFADHIETLQRDGDDLYPIKGFASKAAEHAARIAGVLAFFENPEATEMSSSSINAGIAIAQYYISEALRLFHSANYDQELLLAQKVFDWGVQKQGGIIALADLYRSGPNAVRDKKTATRMIEILEQHYRAERIEGGAEINGKFRRDVWELWG